MAHRIALSHASGVAAEAILEKLSESGIPSDSLVLLDRGSSIGKRLPFADSHLSLQDQSQFDLSSCDLLLMPEADIDLESAALQQDCLLVSHAIRTDSAPILITGANAQPKVSYTQTSLRLAGPETSCLAPVLIELDRLYSIEQINLTLLRSAEFFGKAGVDELASQTIGLLNSRTVEPDVFPQQIAFNLLPETIDAMIDADLRQIMGNSSYSGVLQSVTVPVFHGFAAAIQICFNVEVNIDDCKSHLQALDQVLVKNAPASPIADCNQSFSCVLSQLEQAPKQASNLQFWMIADPMRYGLANNYVNVSDFLLKSFL